MQCGECDPSEAGNPDGYKLPHDLTFNLLTRSGVSASHRRLRRATVHPINHIVKALPKQPKDSAFKQYEIDDTANIWWRVCCYNDVQLTGQEASNSYLGRTGHLERMNVWLHSFGAVIFLVYVLFRPLTPMGEELSLTSSLSALALGSYVITFASSSVYHVYSANRLWSAITRLLDYAGIYLGIACGTYADLSTVTLNLQGVQPQAAADCWIAMGMCIAFFVYRRTQLSIEETHHPYFEQKCSLGLGRTTHVDLEHQSLRAAVGFAMAFAWIMMIPGAFRTLEPDCAWVFSGSRFLGTGFLVAGMVLDNVVLYPDMWYTSDAPPRHSCYMRDETCCTTECCGLHISLPGGWILTSHAIWHVIALLSTITTAAGTEYVVARSGVLREP